MPEQPIDRLRAICLAFPEAVEKEAWGDPTFRVRDKIFAMEKRGGGRLSVWCKAPAGSQMVLVGADPEAAALDLCLALGDGRTAFLPDLRRGGHPDIHAISAARLR